VVGRGLRGMREGGEIVVVVVSGACDVGGWTRRDVWVGGMTIVVGRGLRGTGVRGATTGGCVFDCWHGIDGCCSTRLVDYGCICSFKLCASWFWCARFCWAAVFLVSHVSSSCLW
jgi:hypothetical protein